MKTQLQIILSIILLFFISGVASAEIGEYRHSTEDIWLNQGNSNHTWEFDLIDDTEMNDGDSIEYVGLRIHVEDDEWDMGLRKKRKNNNYEFGELKFDNDTYTDSWEIDTGYWKKDTSWIDVTQYATNDFQLDVTIYNKLYSCNQDYQVDYLELYYSYVKEIPTEPPMPVPEPSTMILLCTGLAAFGLTRKKSNI